jgi:hypothetical protein
VVAALDAALPAVVVGNVVELGLVDTRMPLPAFIGQSTAYFLAANRFPLRTKML